jgi:hypothetical protein
MDISVRTRSESYVELRIESSNMTFTEDLTLCTVSGWIVPDNTVENFITAARDCNLFNGKSDVDFVKRIYDAFLNDYEREQFLELIKNK